ncbi:MAG: serine hydrolase [Bacteroidota bacterium]
MRHLALIILTISLLLSCSSETGSTQASIPSQASPTLWPTRGWTYDTLAHSAQLDAKLDSFPGTYSLLVIQDGKIAYETYQAPYGKDSLIHVNSCTKTVISILFGVLFQDDFAQHENRAAISYFPEYGVSDTHLQQIQVKHFLSMSSGLDWRGGIDATDVIQMSETNDWAKYVFERPIAGPPGESFHYNSGGTQVVSSILHRQSEEGLLAYAQEHLFQPLGISDLQWDLTPTGIPKAGWGLHIKMHDLAKLGYLLLQEGSWEAEQIVPQAWVEKLSRKQVVANDTYDYGYQVWIPTSIGAEGFMFRGGYPPSIKVVTVLPELNSVVVYVGENHNSLDLLREFVVPVLE